MGSLNSEGTTDEMAKCVSSVSKCFPQAGNIGTRELRHTRMLHTHELLDTHGMPAGLFTMEDPRAFQAALVAVVDPASTQSTLDNEPSNLVEA